MSDELWSKIEIGQLKQQLMVSLATQTIYKLYTFFLLFIYV